MLESVLREIEDKFPSDHMLDEDDIEILTKPFPVGDEIDWDAA